MSKLDPTLMHLISKWILHQIASRQKLQKFHWNTSEQGNFLDRKIYEQHCLRRSTLTDELRDGEKSFDWKEVFVQITLGHNFTLTRCIWMCRKNGGQQLAHLSRDFPSQITFVLKKKRDKNAFVNRSTKSLEMGTQINLLISLSIKLVETLFTSQSPVSNPILY